MSQTPANKVRSVPADSGPRPANLFICVFRSKQQTRYLPANKPHHCIGNRNNLNSKAAYLNVATGTVLKSIQARLVSHDQVWGKQIQRSGGET